MKIGSLIECVKKFTSTGYVVPIKGKIYTIRDIGSQVGFNGEVGLLLEEIQNRHHTELKKEYCFKPTSFRELLPPMQISIESILEDELVW